MRAHVANFLCCILRYKAEIGIKKDKKAKETWKKKRPTSNIDYELSEKEWEVSSQTNTNMELKREN